MRADQERVAVARGDAEAARVVFPSNPVVSLTAGQRWNTTGQRALNVTGSLSQRIEVAGARRQRRRVAAAEVTTREHEAAVTERDVTAQALLAYYDVLAAREEVEVLEQGVATASRLAEVAEGRASIGSGAGIEADLARADATALRERLALAKGRGAVAEARLSSSLGLDPSGPQPEVRGDMEPLSTPKGLGAAMRGAHERPEVVAAQSQRQVEQARLGVLNASACRRRPCSCLRRRTDSTNASSEVAFRSRSRCRTRWGEPTAARSGRRRLGSVRPTNAPRPRPA